MAQMAIVMNLDKCVGCHARSVICKQAWTNRSGIEYVWFNNVETRLGLGYLREYENREEWQGDWEVTKHDRLHLRSDGRFHKLLSVLGSPKMPEINDYYRPWACDYQNLLSTPVGQKHFPVAGARSLITEEPMTPKWSPSWDDDLGGAVEYGHKDPVLRGIEDKVKFEFRQTLMFYLPRICEHCLNSACAASYPSSAIYKRTEDSIVLVDQDHYRGWRMYISSYPYKKIYFNHHTGKTGKYIFCYPRVELGIPTIYAETCVERLRYIGLMLYGTSAVLVTAAERDEYKLYEKQLTVFLDPGDPEIHAETERQGIPHDWIEATRRSPVKKLIMDHRVALPLHPEYRTMPVVWYIPPLPPIVDSVASTGYDAEDVNNLLGIIDVLHIPTEYLTNLLTTGNVTPMRTALEKMAVIRFYMRDINLGGVGNEEIVTKAGMTDQEIQDMFRLLAIAKYSGRYVIPSSHKEQAHSLESVSTKCPVGEGGTAPGSDPVTVAIGSYSAAKTRRETAQGQSTFLDWDGHGIPTSGVR